MIARHGLRRFQSVGAVDAVLEDVDRRKPPALGDRALHHDVAVEDAAHRVGDRLIMIVAVDQHAEDAGDGALVGAGAGAFQEPR